MRGGAGGASSAGAGGGGSGGMARAAPHVVPPRWRAAARTAAFVLAGAGATVASLPVLLSTHTGLQAVLSLVNSRLPGPVRVESLRFSLAPGQAGVVEVHASGLQVHEAPELGGQRLVAAEAVRARGSPWQLLTGKPAEVSVAGASVSAAFDADCAAPEFRLVRYLEQAGVLASPPPPDDLLEGGGGGEGTAPQGSGHASSDTAASTARRDERSSQAAESSTVAQRGGGGGDGRQRRDGEEAGAAAPDEGAGESSGGGGGGKRSGSAFTRVLSEVDAGVPLSAELRQPGQRFTLEEGSLQVSQDMRDVLGGGLHVLGAFGPEHLRWFHEQRQGKQPPGALVGQQQGGGAAAPPEQQQHQQSVQQQGEAAAAAPQQQQSEGPQERAAEGGGAARRQWWWEGPPEDAVAAAALERVLGRGGAGQGGGGGGAVSCVPGEWWVMSPNLDMHARLWEVHAPAGGGKGRGGGGGGGGGERELTVLHAPGSLSLRFTRALSRFALAAVNPLLGRVASVSEDSQGLLAAAFIPDGMVLPYRQATMRVEPMCLNVEPGALVTQLSQGLRALGVQLARGSSLLEAWMSGMDVRFRRGGAITQQRVDMLIGPAGMRRAILRQLASLPPSQHQEPQAGAAPSPQLLPSSAVHLVLWGRADPEADALDFVVGLPKDLLEGLSMLQRGSLPEGYVLPIRLRGSMDAPQLEVKGLASRVAQLAWREAALSRRRERQRAERGRQLASHDVEPSPEPSGDGGGSEGEGGTARDGVLPRVTEEVEEEGGEGRVLESAEGGLEEAGKEGGAGGSGWPAGLGWVRGAVRVVSALVRAAAPSEQRVAEIEARMAQDAAAVPPQRCRVPWAPEG